MKKLFSQSLILLCSLIIVTSCSKNSADITSQQNLATQTTDPTAFVNTGTWSITAFAQRNEDKTNQFNGYVFTFSTDGTLQAAKGSSVTNGTWSYSPSVVGYYGSTPSNASFTINLGAASPLGQLTRTWNIDSTATSSSMLALINPEVAEGMILRFSKK